MTSVGPNRNLDADDPSDLGARASALVVGTGGVYQMAYVTTDTARAKEQLGRTLGIESWRTEDVEARYTDGAEARIRISLCWLGSVQIELIEPRGGDDGFYRDPLVERRANLCWHHVAFRLPSVEAWTTLRAELLDEGQRIVAEGGRPDRALFFHVDARSTLGHYVEYLVLGDERSQVHASLPRNVGRRLGLVGD